MTSKDFKSIYPRGLSVIKLAFQKFVEKRDIATNSINSESDSFQSEKTALC
jgi:hypothetical protein